VTAAESWGTPEPDPGKIEIFKFCFKNLGRGQTGFFADYEKIARLYLAIKPLLDWKMATATFSRRLQILLFLCEN
jgi:hypothetical protein